MTNVITTPGSYQALDVYRNAAAASQLVAEKIIPKLSKRDSGPVATKLKRSAKVIPHFIARGNLGAAMAIAGDTVLSLANIHKLSLKEYQDKKLCLDLMDQYDKVGRQLFKLNRARKSKKEKTVA